MTSIRKSDLHAVLGTPLGGPFPPGTQTVLFGMGCFWGAERLYWQRTGVVCTSVGYAGGTTIEPSYKAVCTGQTGHAEVVFVAFDGQRTSFDTLLQAFWESHDPTQGMRQGNDIGTQYRSVIFTTNEAQRADALASKLRYQVALTAAGRGTITTEVAMAPAYYLAEDYHQQYLHKNPNGYCGLGGCGVKF
jgi:peptide-methionine (S)-S-oxide reductase